MNKVDVEKKDVRVGIQKFGRFLSGMVMPNIGAFIAWGLITALFIPTGWIPNENLSTLVGPMITYLLPMLIGYTGGNMIAGVRGGVIGAIATMGVVSGADIPMFLGAMIMGPLGGYIIKKVDNSIEGKVKSGFEMLVNNFSAGIIGMILAILGYMAIGPIVSGLNSILTNAVDIIVAKGLLPLVSIFVEPAKILFLNNAINHGVLGPIGLQEAKEIGKSVFFLIEANPGPGLGILLAYFVFGKGSVKQSTPGAMIIHFLGGIHEIYFPYVLMNPALLLAVIAGGASGVFTFKLFNVGLVASPSPGSIFAVFAMTPRGSFLGVIAGVLVSVIVSFLVASIFVKSTSGKNIDEDFSKATNKMKDLKNKKENALDLKNVRKIVFACDAGMGSSAMGASTLRKKINSAGLNIEVINKAINELPKDADIIITHKNLTQRAMEHSPNKRHISIDNFITSPVYDELVEELLSVNTQDNPNVAQITRSIDKSILLKENILLNQGSTSKEEAIKFVGRLLVDSKYANENYIRGIQSREDKLSTYIGNGIAIPHGDSGFKSDILKSGIVVVQYPNGIDFSDGNMANLLIGIAGRDNEHLEILSNLASVLENEELAKELSVTDDVNRVYNVLMKEF